MAPQFLCWGRAARWTLKIPITCGWSDSCNVPAKSQLATKLRIVGLITWHEVVMCLLYCIDAFDSPMRGIIQSGRPLGGKAVLFSEISRKILLGIKGRSSAEVVHLCVNTVPFYRAFRTLQPYKEYANEFLWHCFRGKRTGTFIYRLSVSAQRRNGFKEQKNRVTPTPLSSFPSQVLRFLWSIFKRIEINSMFEGWLTMPPLLRQRM